MLAFEFYAMAHRTGEPVRLPLGHERRHLSKLMLHTEYLVNDDSSKQLFVLHD
jgi:hypothetical protein